MEITLPHNGWHPRPDQLPLWTYMENGGLRAVEVAHRRWGKDDVALHFTATAAMQRPGNYWHLLPQYNQGRRVIWNAVNPRTGMRRIDEAFPPEIRSGPPRSQDMLIPLKGNSTWQLVGSDNYDTLVGSPPLGIVFSEWALANPLAWAYLAPVLEENGGWAMFIYTSRGNNHGKTTFELAQKRHDWFAQKISAKDTDIFTPEQLVNIREEYRALFGDEFGDALYLQEYECSWEGAILGAYFAGQMRVAREQGRITRVPHDPGMEVDTAWDLGVDDSMSIWFIQPVGKSFNVIDYYEAAGYGLEHYAKILKGEADKSEHRAAYTYGNHYMPHDAAVREMTNAEKAKTRKEVAEDLGIKPIQIVQRARNWNTILQVHIPAARNVLAQCWFDEEKCSKGINSLDNYRAEYDEEKKILGTKPVRDWSIHGADAFRTFAVGYEGKPDNTAILDSLKGRSGGQPQPQGWMA